tara:strand:- start:23 stop:415 length:393 start_codon:yes stop_codon:yes gene_type:complete
MLKLGISTVLLLIIDLIWIRFYMQKQYEIMIPRIQGTSLSVNLKYAILSYICLAFSINYFVLPNIKRNSLKEIVSYGFVFGIILYGVYDFTAAAVLKEWDEITMFIDVFWGGILFALTAYLTNVIVKMIK